MQCVGIHTTRQDLTRCGRYGIVSTSQTGDRVKEDDNIVSALNHALCLLEHDTGNLHVALGRFVEGRGNHLSIDATCHIGHLLGTLVDEQHDHVYLGVVGSDGVGDILQQDGLTGLGLRYDESALTLSDG